MEKFLVDLTITVEVEANDHCHAEVVALEKMNMPGMDVVNVRSLEEECSAQGELFNQSN